MSITKPKKAVIYCRVSSREQEETGYSLPAQEKFLKDYVQKNDFGVVKVFAVSESACGRVRRKIFNKMMDYTRKNKIPIVIVETTDRLTRNFADVPIIDAWVLEDETHQIHLAKEGCILHKNSKSHEWFMWRVKVATAEYYVKVLSENVKKGQKEKLAQGWYPYKPTLGYKTIGDKGHKIHLPDPEIEPFIRKMFELYATGNYTTSRLVETMYNEGLRSRTSNQVKKSRIHGMLRDSFYCGKMTWNGIEYQGKHEPIVSQELWQRVQDILTRENSGGRYRKHFYYLRGLIKCDDCGCSITAARQKGHVYYNCTHYKPCNNNKYIREEILEEQILYGLDKIQIRNVRLLNWIKKALKESHADEVDYHNTALDNLNKRYSQIQKRLDMLYDDKLDGVINAEFYKKKFKQYSEEQDALLAQIKKHKNSNISYFELGSALIDVANRSAEIFKKARDEDKRQLVNLVFSNLVLNGDKLGFSYTKPFQILAHHALAVNSIFEPAKNRINTSKNSLLQAEFAPLLRE